MCRNHRLLALLGLAGAPVLSGQSLPQLHARADSLAHEWRRASAVAEAIDSLERARAIAGRDTIAVGALRIVTNPSALPLREAAARAWPVIDSLYGVEARQLERHPYVVIAVDPDTTVERPVHHDGVEVTWGHDVASLTLFLLAATPIAPPDTALQSWLGGSVRPPIHAEQQRAGVYVQLVTAPSQTARRCFLGDIGGCRDALDLGAGADPVRRWYPSAAERRSLVLTSFADYFNYSNYGTRKPTLQACVQGSDSACTALLQAFPRTSLPRPLTSDARQTLVHLALRMGGRDAYHRLIADSRASVADRVAGAAGINIDSLVYRWRGAILASRPAPVTLPPWGVWIGLAWTGLFAACGLRSSRWRVS